MKRQSRQQRKPNPAAIRITERDLHVLHALYRYRYLTPQQLQRLYFPSLHRTYERLRQLYDRALVDRISIGIYTAAMNTPQLYVLDKAGFDLLLAHNLLDTDWEHINKKLSASFLAHNLATNDCHIAVEITCRQADWQLMRWDNESELRAKNIQVPLSATEVATLIPDSYCHIQVATTIYRFFFEIDMGTMTLQRFQGKVQAYLAYRQLEQHRGHDGHFHVLIITPSLERLHNLKQAVEQVGGDAYFHFAHLENIQQNTIYPPSIWYTAQHTGVKQLLQF